MDAGPVKRERFRVRHGSAALRTLRAKTQREIAKLAGVRPAVRLVIHAGGSPAHVAGVYLRIPAAGPVLGPLAFALGRRSPDAGDAHFATRFRAANRAGEPV